MEGYLASVERIKSGLKTLQAAKLTFCRVTTRRLVPLPSSIHG